MHVFKPQTTPLGGSFDSPRLNGVLSDVEYAINMHGRLNSPETAPNLHPLRLVTWNFTAVAEVDLEGNYQLLSEENFPYCGP